MKKFGLIDGQQVLLTDKQQMKWGKVSQAVKSHRIKGQSVKDLKELAPSIVHLKFYSSESNTKISRSQKLSLSKCYWANWGPVNALTSILVTNAQLYLIDYKSNHTSIVFWTFWQSAENMMWSFSLIASWFLLNLSWCSPPLRISIYLKQIWQWQNCLLRIKIHKLIVETSYCLAFYLKKNRLLLLKYK